VAFSPDFVDFDKKLRKVQSLNVALVCMYTVLEASILYFFLEFQLESNEEL
jgi:hypothetical protein